MSVIAGQQLWNRRTVTIPPDTVVEVAHGLELVNGGLDPNDIQVMYCFLSAGNTNDLEITSVSATVVELTNTGFGEGAATITIAALFWLPHTLAGPRLNDAYVPNTSI